MAHVPINKNNSIKFTNPEKLLGVVVKMKSFLFLCEENSRDGQNYLNKKTRPGDRWFFGENDIINKQEKCLNIPLDPHNYRKVVFDNIVTCNADNLNTLASELTNHYFLNSINGLIISTSYTFGDNCPLLLEGIFNDNNILIGPGLFLLILKNILTKIQSSDGENNYTLHCTWNGVSNTGEFTDMFENSDNRDDLFDMISMSPINENFGFCQSLKIESVNSLASIINEKRRTKNWRNMCHYIFTLRLFDSFYDTSIVRDGCLSSITLVSLGEGIKTKFSGQTSPWDVLDIAMKNHDKKNNNLSMTNFAHYINDFFDSPELISVIYRFPFYINPMIPNHAKEIKFILNLMLFHQTFCDFFLFKNNENDQNYEDYFYNYTDTHSLKPENQEKLKNSFNFQEYGYDSMSPISSFERSSIFFPQELNDAPIPPPTPVRQTKSLTDSIVLPDFSSKLTYLESEDELYDKFLDIKENIENRSIVQPSVQESDFSKINDLQNEVFALKQEINILENTLIDKNEIIIRLEKLIETRDHIIKQSQETIRSLKQNLDDELLKTNELKNKLKIRKETNVGFYPQEKQKSTPLLQRVRPLTANNSKLDNISDAHKDIERSETERKQTIEECKLERDDENIVKQMILNKTPFSDVARMAIEKFIGD